MIRKTRKIIFWIGGAILLLVVVLAAIPLWFPWVLKPLAKKQNLQYARYIREGYSRFRLESVVFNDYGVRVTAGQARFFTPPIWAWHHLRSDRLLTYAAANDWTLEVVPSTNTAGGGPISTERIAKQVGKILVGLDRWFPGVAATNGSIRIENRVLSIEGFAWKERRFLARTRVLELPAPVLIDGVINAPGPTVVHAQYAPLDLKATLEAAHSSTNFQVRGIIDFRTNQCQVSADFGGSNPLPERASFICPAFSFPAKVVSLSGYGEIQGGISLLWDRSQFAAEFRAHGDQQTNTAYPPVDVEFSAKGDLGHANVERLMVAIPGLRASLSNQISFPFSKAAPPALLGVSGDLSRQPWYPLAGLINGTAVLSAGPSTNALPHAEFDLALTNFGVAKIKIPRVRLAGTFDWPLLAIREVRVELPSNAVATATGTLDISRRTVQQGEFRFNGRVGPGLPFEGYAVSNATLIAHFQGALTDIEHSAELQFRDLQIPQLKLLNGELRSHGHGRNLELDSTVNAGRSVLRVSGSAALTGTTNNFVVSQLALTSGNDPLLALAAPVSIEFEMNPNSSNRWQLRIAPTVLRGPNREISFAADLHWPDEGRCTGLIHGLELSEFGDFVGTNWTAMRIDDLQLNSEWKRGPMRFSVLGGATIHEAPGFTAQFQIEGNSSSLVVSNLTVTSESAPVMNVQGSLPFVINPTAGTNIISSVPRQPLRLRAEMEPDPQFWRRVESLANIQVVRPHLSVDISGAWDSPTGSVHASAARISLLKTKRPIPAIEDLRLEMQIEPQRLRLEPLRFSVEQQPVELTAELPLDAQFYDSLARRKVPDFERGQARLLIEHAPLAAFRRYAPGFLIPLGTVAAEVVVRPGGHYGGYVAVQGAATQPLGEFGAVRDITGRLVLRERTVSLEKLTATIGGQPIEVAGSADLSGFEWMRGAGPVKAGSTNPIAPGALPPFSLTVKGQNVPLSRQPQVILRSDLDIKAVHTKTNQPVITGTITLQKSVFTSDIESLITGIEKPSERPPYFSIEVEPLAAFRLDCVVKGDRFLKVQTPFFHGAVSANFKLEGTLKEPLATGQATIANGQIELPFGTLDIVQGIVSLTAANPYQPEIFLTARSRRFGYDITVEVTGPASKPNIQFSSVPSLSSDQILLMLTAGQLPREEQALTPQEKAQRFALFLGERLLAKLGIGGTSDRLVIRSGEDFSESGRQTYDVEYKITKKWSVVGQYDRFNAFNLSLKRLIYSR